LAFNPRDRQSDNIRINHRIRAREVRVIGADGSQLGVMDTRRALEMAQQQGLDLAEIAPTSNPPVCKILDYGKYKYELKKKAKQAKKNQVVTQLKEVQFRPQTDVHDVDFKVKHIQRFLDEGNKVKVSVRFRGREASHAELGHALIKQIIDLIGTSGIVEQSPKMEGKILSLIVAPGGKAAANKPKKPVAAAENKPSVPPSKAPTGSKVSVGTAPKTGSVAGSVKTDG